MKKKYIMLFIWGTAVSLAWTQTVIQGKLFPQGSDITALAAANKAKAFLTMLKFESGNVADFKARLEKRYGFPGRKQWEISTMSARVKVDSQSGLVVSFVNAKREDDRYRGRGRKGERFAPSESFAKVHLRKLATILGIPSSAQMVNFSMEGDGIGNDTNPMGHFGCVFKNAKQEIVATLACDFQDGLILYYTRPRQS